MKPAASLSASALAAALLLGGVETTTAAWRDGATVDGSTITSGLLDVALVRDGENATTEEDSHHLEPGTPLTTGYTLSTAVAGDNLDAVMGLSIPEWSTSASDPTLLDALTISVELRRGDVSVADGVLDDEGVFRFDGKSTFPVGTSPDQSTPLDVTLTVAMTTQGDEYQGLSLAEGQLVAEVRQVRSSETGGTGGSGAGLWAASDIASAPDVSTAAPPPDPEPAAQDAPAAAADDAPPSTVDESDTDGGQVESKPADTTVSDNPAARDEQPSEGDPEWAGELLDLLDETGVDPSNIDLTELPVEVEEWAAANRLDLADVVAWLEMWIARGTS